MARLTTANIKFVKERTMDGATYGWFVSVKGGASESRDYADYALNELPKTVQRFIAEHRAETFTSCTNPDGSVFTEYIYQ